MTRDFYEDANRAGRVGGIHRSLLQVSEILAKLGLRVFVIGARSAIVHGVDLGRETRDWDIAVDKPFTPELRDAITRELRSRGFKVQWRKWGFLVEDDIHIDINYAPLTLDEEFIERSKSVVGDILLLPSIEDIVVLKLMSGERKDTDDVKKMLVQTWHRLDKEYLYKRARQAGLERKLERILRRLRLG
ncbi:MAG: hypothetical protein F7C38_07520 [Desulfurococcales archaeon]|nr:hypothetical protein [Desulfurococcales archaeon]